MTHEELMRTHLFNGNNGVYAFNSETKSVKLVFNKDCVAPEFYNVLKAAIMFYQFSHCNYAIIENLITVLESAEADSIIPALVNINASIALSHRIAIEGIENVTQVTTKH
jgi:hypothetical protein